MELAAAILTVFFYGNMTQRGANLMIKLINIVSIIQVPTRFDSILSNFMAQNKLDGIGHEKRWYCEVCYKLCTMTKDDRFKRSCDTCKSK